MTNEPAPAGLSGSELGKQRAGRFAAGFVESGMKVGLGTGSTVHHMMVALAEKSLDIACVATSRRTEARARELGLRMITADEAGRLEIAIDGADEVDPMCHLVKGGGGAHTREKVVAEMADKFVVVVDDSKLVEALGAFGLPVEVLDFAPGIASARLEALGAEMVTVLPERSDGGNVLLRVMFEVIEDPAELAASIKAIPGVVEHGLFLNWCVARVIVGTSEGQVRQIFPPH